MGHSDLDSAIHHRRPWNAGKNVGAIENIVRYLGVDVDDALTLSE